MSQPKRTSLRFLDIVWEYKFSLAFYIVGISFLTFAVLYLFGGVPEELKVVDSSNNSLGAQTTEVQASSSSKAHLTLDNNVQTGGELPVRIMISKIGVDSTISNPTSANNDVLNNWLLKGAVRYPGSGTLGNGNVFIFGHSTGIRIVNNQAFKTFNHLKNLNPDDEIRVESLDKAYIYKVTSVKLVDSDQVLVDFSEPKNMLTLSTCDVFGQKQQRFVVEATFEKTINL